jgi:hypothetical protein
MDIVGKIGRTWNFDKWKRAGLLVNAILVEEFKSNDVFPSFCDFRNIELGVNGQTGHVP